MAIANRRLASPSSTPVTGADLLRAARSAHGLTTPRDLASGVGSGARTPSNPTLWTLNAAQTLVVANTTRTAAFDAAAVDAFDWGRIAASAALSAIHATAASPLFARLTLACPAAVGDDARQALVDGVAVAMHAASAVLAEVDIVEVERSDTAVLRCDVLISGIVRPDRIRGPSGAQPGDALILTGLLGGGIYAAAHARRKLTDDDRRALIAGGTQANRVGIALGAIRNVHAVATVGPDGLPAAILALADAADLTAAISAAAVPALPRALAFARTGAVAADSSRNWNRDGARIALADTVMPETRSLLSDPVTSGALLIACKPESADRVLALCHVDDGSAAVIGAFGSAHRNGGPQRPLAIGA